MLNVVLDWLMNLIYKFKTKKNYNYNKSFTKKSNYAMIWIVGMLAYYLYQVIFFFTYLKSKLIMKNLQYTLNTEDFLFPN